MDTQQHGSTFHLIRICKSGIDLESAYKVMIKAFLRKQSELSEARKPEDPSGIQNMKVPTIEQKDIGYSSNPIETSS